MIRRVKVKRQAIGRLTDDFRRSKDALTAKLGSQLGRLCAEPAPQSTFPNLRVLSWLPDSAS
jgi:hypothetical protein